MRVLQILAPGASGYERKSLKLDSLMAGREDGLQLQLLSPGTSQDLPPIEGNPSLAHVYGSPAQVWNLLKPLNIPYLAAQSPQSSTLPWRRIPPPAKSSSPLDGLPEAVDRSYFSYAPRRFPQVEGKYTVASCLPERKRVKEVVHGTMRRISAFRNDVDWLLFDEMPEPVEMNEVDLWVDPATDPADWDGGTAEAMAAGILTISSRTPIGTLRSGDGSAGILVRPDDANELTHAVARALFRPETTEELRLAAREMAASFDPDHRSGQLLNLYREFGS